MVSLENLNEFGKMLIEILSEKNTIKDSKDKKFTKDLAFIIQIRFILLVLKHMIYEKDSSSNTTYTINNILTENNEKYINWENFPAQDFISKNITEINLIISKNSISINSLIEDFSTKIVDDLRKEKKTNIIFTLDKILNSYIISIRDSSNGTVYTPPIIADFMIKKIFDGIFKNKKENNDLKNGELIENGNLNNLNFILSKLNDVKILDLAVGSGNFIFSMFDYFENSSFELIERNNLSVILHKLLNSIVVIDIDLQALELFYIRLYMKFMLYDLKYKKNNIRQNLKVNIEIIEGNTLFKLKNTKFDIIIGNPPYYSIRNIHSELKKKYSMLFESYHANGDIYYLFIEKALKLFRNNNSIVCLIVPRYFKKAPTATNLNQILASYSIKNIWEFEKLPFKASIHPIIIFIGKKSSASNIEEKTSVNTLLLKQNKIYEESKDNLLRNDINYSKNDIYIQEIWKKMLETDKNKFKRLIEICQVSKGVQTGKDAVFVVNKEIINKFMFETEFLKPWLKGRMIKPYEITPSESLFVIHSTQFNAQQITKVKNIMKYLNGFKDELKNRSRVKEELWFTWRKGDERSTLNWDSSKIITPYKSVSNCFALDTNNNYFSQDIVTIIPKPNYQHYTNYLLALLNSEFIFEFVKSEFKELKQGLFEFYPQQLNKIPIILPDKKTNSEITDKVNMIFEMKIEKKSFNEIISEINQKIIDIYKKEILL